MEYKRAKENRRKKKNAEKELNEKQTESKCYNRTV